MASNIDPSKPSGPIAYTADVRGNFAAAKVEIEALQVNGGGGGGAGVTKTDRSGVITLGGTAQTLMAANSARKGWSFQNKSATDMYFNDLGNSASATSNSSVYLPAGAYYESEPGGASIAAISIFCATTNAPFVAKEW
jgi:hypothetical protein